MDNAAGDAIAASPLNRIRPDVVRLFEGMQRSRMRELDFGFSRAELIAVDGVEPACNQILHSRHTLIGMISGEQEFDIAAQGAAAWRGLKQAGGMGFYPAGRQVTSRFLTKKMTTLAVFIDPEASRETLGVELADQRWQTRISAEDPFLSAIFLQLGGVMQGDHDTFAQLMSETLMTLLHLQVLERFANRAPPASKGKESLTRALDLIHSELPHSVPLSALVAASGLPKLDSYRHSGSGRERRRTSTSFENGSSEPACCCAPPGDRSTKWRTRWDSRTRGIWPGCFARDSVRPRELGGTRTAIFDRC